MLKKISILSFLFVLNNALAPNETPQEPHPAFAKIHAAMKVNADANEKIRMENRKHFFDTLVATARSDFQSNAIDKKIFASLMDLIFQHCRTTITIGTPIRNEIKNPKTEKDMKEVVFNLANLKPGEHCLISEESKILLSVDTSYRILIGRESELAPSKL